ncbi:Sodium/hydrogen exchanger domain-containing protein 1 [Fasciola hepatica]|uniref:Sodium/hydrogen exchanger domain-containing protein 1 n=1 Tax=Fasciola hepatica TaxID=6192 RepID=A0A4E0RNF5_FASHE|nr:Sodium/hydrogen exchanger domain-containing protein 1 [Fasciola hepatica]
MRDSDGETSPHVAGTLEENIKLGLFGRCRRQCGACLKQLRLPRWIKKPLFLLYTWLGGAMTYAILITVVYTSIMSLRPPLALPPKCRRMAVPGYASTTVTSEVIGSTVPTARTSPESASFNRLPSGFTLALECQQGEALSVLIFYAFGFIVGEAMELMHLPGLFGMLLGGLTLRNLGTLFISEQIYHQSTVPNGSYPIDANNTLISQDLASFDVSDSRTQVAALLLVNPSLSGVLRQLALATILSRAGLGLDPATLKQVCGSVFRLAIIPCLTEAAALMLITRFLIGWPWTWGAILGFACAAVSPAVIVPNMMRLEVAGWGVAEGIPTLVVAASSLDDVLAITGFGVALAVALSTGENLAATLFWGPAEAFCGAAFGAAVGSLLCLFPPPKLEHSHLIRGIILICLAVTGLVGSVGLHLPGAGALACLTLSFVVAMGWRAGLPWRLTQPSEPNVETPSHEFSTNTATGGTSKWGRRSPSPDSHSLTADETAPDLTGANKPGKPMGFFRHLDVSSKSEPIRHTAELPGLSAQPSNKRGRGHEDSTSSNIMENLIEYHPYYCSILRQQYTSQQSRQSASLRGSAKSSIRQLTGGDLPAIAVAVAATGGSGTERRDSGRNLIGQGAFARRRSCVSRRFSLPEPTAHYEMESFSTSDSANCGVSPPSTRSSGRHGAQRGRRRLLSPTSREQYSAVCSQPVDKLEELAECEDELGTVTQLMKPCRPGEQNSNVDADRDQEEYSAPEPDILLPATPEERGLACLNSMRQTLAAVWWFVQPILFSLIGAEVNLYTLGGASTGRGVACLIIAVLIRMGATILAVLPSNLNMRERVFVAFAWLPKATVQAAIGPVALDTARQLHSSAEIIGYGEVVLTLAAIAIILTAPIGAILMPVTAPYLLRQDLRASEVMVARTRQNTSTKQPNSSVNKSSERPDYHSSANNVPTNGSTVDMPKTNLVTGPQDGT